MLRMFAIDQVLVVPAAIDLHQLRVCAEGLAEQRVVDLHMRLVFVLTDGGDFHGIERVIDGESINRQQLFDAAIRDGVLLHRSVEIHVLQLVGAFQVELSCRDDGYANRLLGLVLIEPWCLLCPGKQHVEHIARLLLLRFRHRFVLRDAGADDGLTDADHDGQLVVILRIHLRELGLELIVQLGFRVGRGELLDGLIEAGTVVVGDWVLVGVGVRPVGAQVAVVGRGQGVLPEAVEIAVLDQRRRQKIDALRID